MNGGRIFLGFIFFAASLTPTLVPRGELVQGLLSGAALAIGYAIGTGAHALWRYLELPQLHSRARPVLNILAMSGCVLLAGVSLWKATEWQNSVRAAMGMEPAEPTWSLVLCISAAIAFVLILAVAWLFKALTRLFASRINRFAPRRAANVVAVLAAAALFWSVANDVIVRTALSMLDSSFAELDRRIEPERPQPTSPDKTGSARSLVRWDELGRTGRRFVASGPGAERIGAFTARPAQTPIRVYVGLLGAATAEARARLALDELQRQGGFDRSILIIVTPTGTGWIDPSAMDSVEYLHDGDVASVAVQYSYLNSPLSLMVQPEFGAEAARALFREIYGHWTTLPRDKRPRLYLHGLSLGSLNSEKSAELFEILGDPPNGALWSGPPFANGFWRSFTQGRKQGTPAWLPEFRDGRLVRFMNQNGSPVQGDAPWGPFRIVYLQYASDPITFFSFETAWRRPAWIGQPRGPDVSSSMQWYPIVTMLQLAIDMGFSNHTPMGFGHVFAPEHYVDAWIALTDPQHWTHDAISRLKQHLATEARRTPPGPLSPYDDRGG